MKRNDLREGRSAAGLSTCRLSAPLLASKNSKKDAILSIIFQIKYAIV